MVIGKIGLRRRRNIRGSPRAVALLTFPGKRRVGPYQVENLSAGGALLRGYPIPELEAGVELELHLPRHAPIHVAGVVLRRHAAAGAETLLAVVFRDTTKDIEDAIGAAILRALDKARYPATPAVLILGTAREHGVTLARCLSSLGCLVTPAITTLDAMRSLQDPRRPVDVLLAREESRQINVVAFWSIMNEDFPGVRRVLVTRKDRAEPAAATQLAHAVLFEPWDSHRLAAAVGVTVDGA
jgi:hypothetical protein